MRKWFYSIIAFALVGLVLAGCKEESTGAGPESIEKFTIAYLPAEGAENVKESSGKFEKALSEKLGVPVESFNATSYSAAIEAMKNGKADMALYGSFAYIVGVERAGIEAIVGVKYPVPVKSVIITSKDSDIQAISDLKGKSFGFVDPVSASGHLLPKAYILDELSITPEELENDFFKDVQFAGGQENAVLGAVNEQYDAAAVASTMPGILEERGLIKKDSYNVIATTEEGPPVAFAVRGDLPQEIKSNVQSFIMNYDDPSFIESIMGIPDTSFIEVNDSTYDSVRDISKTLGLSDEQLLNN